MEHIDESSGGYPEEQPPGADPGGGDRREETPAREDAERAPKQDDGKATGNPQVDE
ncbi:MAG TPA: hypothetical protein VFM58_13425 [Solirubrobacteraceae bacterium]|jgi:hypothetical protein|nr:hypothetical protein [Solirubrobacteraceae bacterium]